MTRLGYVSDWDDPTDPYAEGAPYLVNVEATTSQHVEVNGENLCALPSTPSGALWEITEVATGDVKTLDDDGAGIEGNPYRGGERVAVGDAIVPFQQTRLAFSPFGFRRLRIAGPGSGHTYAARVPRCWNDKDVAEILHSLTRYHGTLDGSDMLALLDIDSFADVHEWLYDLPHRRIAHCLYTRVESKITDDVVSLLRQSGARFAFAIETDGVVRGRLYLPNAYNAPELALDFSDATDAVTQSSLEYAPELLANRIRSIPGPFVEYEAFDQASAPPNSVTLPTRRGAGDRLTHAATDLDSVTRFGLQEARELSCNWTPHLDHVRNCVDVARWSDVPRRVTFAQGALALDNMPGTILEITDAATGIDGDPFIVTELNLNLDKMVGTTTAIEHVTAPTLSPLAIPDPWFVLDAEDLSGLTIGDDVESWDDAVSGDTIADGQFTGAGSWPLYDVQDGVPCIEFSDENAFALWLGATSAEVQSTDEVTIVALVRPYLSAGGLRTVMHFDQSGGTTNDSALRLQGSDARGPQLLFRGTNFSRVGNATDVNTERWTVVAWRLAAGGDNANSYAQGRTYVVHFTDPTDPDDFTFRVQQANPPQIDNGLVADTSVLVGAATGATENIGAHLGCLAAYKRALSFPEIHALARHLLARAS